MPSKDTGTTTTKETAAVAESESYQSERARPDSNVDPDFIDLSTFEQILEMDDDEDHEFSRTIVFGFMEQAEETFKKMRDHLNQKDLHELSQLGHFLKGSSATLGLTKVKDHCEKIQNLGSGRDETGNASIDDSELNLARIKSALGEMEKEYTRVRVYFTRYYEDPLKNFQP
ncbi:unnamed protein product [Tuber melanosporum]|jgi:osomolarity two-component system phosphorelay intermediate protein YPD1|uniref:(Perigord truffle) hypothetical protein n=1 Tax=Tuber melanosporum (strain Mel28) TaxID=656061 RepID=D5GIT4_TUBMM|nr:uncharacterized protein GSTUM_00008666001 [Tuber melanosporum]CAZ84427.1 unnamed protein product [Tuber melanosporum]